MKTRRHGARPFLYGRDLAIRRDIDNWRNSKNILRIIRKKIADLWHYASRKSIVVDSKKLEREAGEKPHALFLIPLELRQ